MNEHRRLERMSFKKMRRLRKQAKELLQMASKVYHYRRDLLDEKSLKNLEDRVHSVELACKDKSIGTEAFQSALEQLDATLREHGGKIYPKTFWGDNLEVLLVAAIIVIGVRTFFFQPFIIPTNSMYPTYNGMTYRIYDQEDTSINKPWQRVANKVRLGANHKSLISKNEGKLRIPIAGFDPKGNPGFLRKQVEGKKWIVLPTVLSEYTFYVNDQRYTLRVPGEFDMNSLLNEAFSSPGSKIIPSSIGSTDYVLETDQYIKAGDPIIRFDINLGDALFVDRISYHFRQPKVGDPFVFRTKEIGQGLGDKYYIKRLSGVAGETLEIRDGTLFADGEPRDEVEAFVRNAEKFEEYEGYMNHGLLEEGRKLIIPEKSFVALGDNSDNSKDSRTWGFVPDKSVIGKAVFIYYPFTSHWGLAE